MLINYAHKRGIHCESASTKNLLKFRGYDMSEVLVFGISGGYDFIHYLFLFFKVENLLFLEVFPEKFLNNLLKE